MINENQEAIKIQGNTPCLTCAFTKMKFLIVFVIFSVAFSSSFLELRCLAFVLVQVVVGYPSISWNHKFNHIRKFHLIVAHFWNYSAKQSLTFEFGF